MQPILQGKTRKKKKSKEKWNQDPPYERAERSSGLEETQVTLEFSAIDKSCGKKIQQKIIKKKKRENH